MSVLTLKLAAPLQSWGSSSRYARRTTEDAPTKSGVIGLLAAAQGLARDDDDQLARLAGLRFGVRVEQPGTRIRDFQTAHDWDTGTSMPLSERFYLADAVFVAAVEGETELIAELLSALRNPFYMPYLGRRSCPPASDIPLGVHEHATIETALKDEPWHASMWYQRRRRVEPKVELNTFIEVRNGDSQNGLTNADADYLRDQPRSFNPRHRRYSLRLVVAGKVAVANPSAVKASGARRDGRAPDHDPTSALEVA